MSGAREPAPVLTIDGPSGSGKGTVSRAVAQRLGWHLLDSGALYRLVALLGREQGLAPEDREAHAAAARAMHVRFGAAADGSERIELNGRDVSAEIRTELTGQGASRVAAWPAVREALLDRQRAFVQPPGLVGDGRDMGTVIFPNAALKIFLNATPDERARRRYNQLKDKGSAVSLAALSREIAERDSRDSSRIAAPLKPADDAVSVDSTGMTAAEVIEHVLELARGRGLLR
jgi:CMP/dCMP kinase